MDSAAALLPWLSCAIGVGMFFLPLLTRDPIRRRDLQLSLNSGRAGWKILMTYVGLSSVAMLILGLFLTPVYPYLWGMIPLASATLYLVGYFVYIDRLPFPDFGGEEEEDDGEDEGPPAS